MNRTLWLLTFVAFIATSAVSGCATGGGRPDRRGVAPAKPLDSLQTRNDSLQQHISQLETDLLDREEQIRALRLELQRLKEIDLKPRQRRPIPR